MFFEVREMMLDVKIDDSIVKVQKPAVICNNVKAFIDFVITERHLEGQICIKIVGADGGGGFFKVCINIYADPEEITKPHAKKFAVQNSKGSAPAKFKDSGVKKLLLLAIVEGIPETYDNVKVIFMALDIEHVDFCLACDLKLTNIVFGLQSHSSTYPCVYCLSKKGFSESGLLRTLGFLKESVKAFKESGLTAKDGKLFYNTINEPLIKGPNSILEHASSS